VLTVGFVARAGKVYLACAATHRTAFTGSRGHPMTLRFAVNMVHPLDDMGTISVGCARLQKHALVAHTAVQSRHGPTRCHASWIYISTVLSLLLPLASLRGLCCTTGVHVDPRGNHYRCLHFLYPCVAHAVWHSGAPSTIQQSVLDPSNLRPVLACISVAVILMGLLYLAHVNKTRNERERRRQLYTKTGSFASELPLTGVPQDVRLLFYWISLWC
jgi:hypothetical protein